NPSLGKLSEFSFERDFPKVTEEGYPVERSDIDSITECDNNLSNSPLAEALRNSSTLTKIGEIENRK
ncbi:MAG: hypothetical protein LDL41_15480, partial [Coleofasciculus sp. S288]|nr:hypothetical protein [Coleofasciculus sp. S288]